MATTGSYDVVVVGAGAAGCVAVARLATGHSVLLLESGPDLRAEPPLSLLDGWSLNRDYYWSIESEPDDRGEANMIPRCRLVGGTSWMTRFAIRGSPADFAEWAGLGNPGWAWDDVLPYFTRLESDADFGGEPWHGSTGPMPVDRYAALERSEVHETAIRAIEASGIGRVDDHNLPGAIGVGRMPMSSRGGRRVSAADAYLPIGNTPATLTVRPDTSVSRFVMDGLRARGVQLADGSIVETGWASCPPEYSPAPRFSCILGSGRPRTCGRWAFPCRSTCPASGRGWEIIRARTWTSATRARGFRVRSSIRSRHSTAGRLPPPTPQT